MASVVMQQRNIKIQLNDDIRRKAEHLKVDLDLSWNALLHEALVLMLRHHGTAERLPEPLTPAGAQTRSSEAQNASNHTGGSR